VILRNGLSEPKETKEAMRDIVPFRASGSGRPRHQRSAGSGPGMIKVLARQKMDTRSGCAGRCTQRSARGRVNSRNGHRRREWDTQTDKCLCLIHNCEVCPSLMS